MQACSRPRSRTRLCIRVGLWRAGALDGLDHGEGLSGCVVGEIGERDEPGEQALDLREFRTVCAPGDCPTPNIEAAPCLAPSECLTRVHVWLPSPSPRRPHEWRP